MNVNDLICVGAEPLALLDYLAVEHADPRLLEQIAIGLRAGRRGGRGRDPRRRGLPVARGDPRATRRRTASTWSARRSGRSRSTRSSTAAALRPGDALIGLPASGVHSNGLTLARRALLHDGELALDRRPDAARRRERRRRAARADRDLRARDPGAAAQRASRSAAWRTSPAAGCSTCCGSATASASRSPTPLPVPPVFELIAELGEVPVARDVGGVQHGLRLLSRSSPRATPTRPSRCSQSITPARP